MTVLCFLQKMDLYLVFTSATSVLVCGSVDANISKISIMGLKFDDNNTDNNNNNDKCCQLNLIEK